MLPKFIRNICTLYIYTLYLLLIYLYKLNCRNYYLYIYIVAHFCTVKTTYIYIFIIEIRGISPEMEWPEIDGIRSFDLGRLEWPLI